MLKRAFHLTLSAICITGCVLTMGCAKTPEATEPDPEDVGDSKSIFRPYPNVLPQDGSADVPLSPFNLMTLVQEKLVSQGIDCQGIYGDEDRVYPTIPGVVYVQWDTSSDGMRYIGNLSGDPAACQRIENITDAKDAAGASMTPTDIPKDIRVLRYPEDGIDPYAFLGIPRQK